VVRPLSLGDTDMPVIIRQLPLSDSRTTLPVPGGSVSLKPLQIPLSVSLTSEDQPSFRPGTPRFPALLDTGFNGTVVLQEQHLNQWAGLRREQLVRVSEMTVHGHRVPVYAAQLWLHANVPGAREDSAEGRPFGIRLYPGIAVCPRGLSQRRLPLLGLRTLLLGDLQVSFRWSALRFSLRTTPWWHWLLG
jgi:hypothetical protein